MSADAALVKRCLTGCPASARELVERFQSDVLAVCRRLLTSEHDAEDVAQEVFIRVFRSMNRWDGERPLRPWILGIAVNRCRTWIGKRARTPSLADYLDDAPDRKPTDDSAELAGELRTAVDGCGTSTVRCLCCSTNTVNRMRRSRKRWGARLER